MMPDKNELATRPIGRRKLSIGLWLVTHRLVLKRLLVVALAATCLTFYGITAWVVYDLSTSQAAYRQMMQTLSADLIDYPTLRRLMAPQPLQFTPPVALPAGGELVDLAVRVTNPNAKYMVGSIVIEFLDGAGQVVGSVTSYVYPGESKHLFHFGVPLPSGSLQVRLVNVGWSRVQPAEFAQLRAERLQLAITDVVHQRAEELGGVSRLVSGRTTFTVTNNSIYGVWDLGLYVLLMNGDQVAAASFTRIRQLAPQGRQEMVVSWPQVLPITTSVSIVPEINVTDPGAFFDYHAPSAVPR